MSTKKTAASSAATEAKTAASETVKAAAKSVAEKKTATKAAKPAAEKKPAAKPVKAAKPAAAKTETKAAPAKKTAAKSAAKTEAKTTAAKKTTKKAAPVVSAETICAKLEKKISKSKAAAIKEKIAVNIEVYGFTEGEASQKMYIEVNEGKVVVSPYEYNAWTVRVSVNLENALAFVDGKKTLKDLISASEGFFAEGKIVEAVKIASIF